MPSQTKSNVEPWELARAMLGKVDEAALGRMHKARQLLVDVLDRLYVCAEDMRKAQDSLVTVGTVRGVCLRAIEGRDDSRDFDRFRPGMHLESEEWSGLTGQEEQLRFEIGECIQSTSSPGGIDNPIQCITRTLKESLAGFELWRLERDLEEWKPERLQLLVDAGRRNGWLEVGDG